MGKLDELRRGAGANVAESMGKGVLLGDVTHGAAVPRSAPADRWAGVERLAGAQRIAIDRVERDPTQPREDFDGEEAKAALAELAESIRARGILQPIRVRWSEERGMYVVIAGERRLRAAQAAGQVDVPCVIHDGTLSEADLLLDQLAENLIRLDLQPVEQARAFRRLMDANGWSARRLADELHIDHDKVNRAVRLLRLPEDLQAQVESGTVPVSAAAEVAKVGDEATQRAIIGKLAAGTMTRDEAVEEVRQVAPRVAGGKAKGKGKGRKVTTRTIRTAIGVKVTLERAKGLDADAIRAALAEVLARLDAEGEGRGDQAA
jgi:ParB family chromosome partitioning protein